MRLSLGWLEVGVVSVPGRWRPSGVRGSAGELRGRRRECELLDRLLDVVREGAGRALVVRGERTFEGTFLDPASTPMPSPSARSGQVDIWVTDFLAPP